MGALVVSLTPTAAQPSACGRSFRSLFRQVNASDPGSGQGGPVDQQGLADAGVAHNCDVDAILNLLLAPQAKQPHVAFAGTQMQSAPARPWLCAQVRYLRESKPKV